MLHLLPPWTKLHFVQLHSKPADGNMPDLHFRPPPLFFFAKISKAYIKFTLQLDGKTATDSQAGGFRDSKNSKGKTTLKVNVVILPSVLLDSSVILNGLQDVCHPLHPPVCFKKNPTFNVGVRSGCV